MSITDLRSPILVSSYWEETNQAQHGQEHIAPHPFGLRTAWPLSH